MHIGDALLSRGDEYLGKPSVQSPCGAWRKKSVFTCGGLNAKICGLNVFPQSISRRSTYRLTDCPRSLARNLDHDSDKMTRRNQSLDVLRGIAVIMVIVSHYPYFAWMQVGWF